MKKTKIIITLVSSIFLLFLIFALYNNYKHNQYIDTKEQNSFRIIQQIVDGKIIFFRKLISKRVKNGLNNNKSVKKAIISEDPEKYKAALAYMFKTLKRENRYIKTFHYISPKNISLFRAHRPEKFGDDLTYLREIVRSANKQQRALYGFESGLYQLVYRLDIPVRYNGKYYGILEVGIDPLLFVEDLAIIDKYLDAAVLIDNKYAKVFKDHEKLKDQLIKNDRYTLMGTSKIFKYIFKNNLIETHDSIKFKDNHYKLFSYNLLSFDGIPNGKLLFALYNSDDIKWKNNNLDTTIILLLILVLVIFIIVYYTFDFYEKKIKKLTEAEKQHERVLHQQSKMASMGEMIGNIAHQWRQPLSIISTAASGMKIQNEYGMLDDNKLNEATDNIINQTEYMSKTIDDFRDFFKSDKDKVTFKFNTILEQTLVLVESSFKNNHIRIIKKLDNDVMISGFQSELTQAILNILNNAKDQLIKIDIEEDRILQIETKIKEHSIILTITDNAGGIDEKIINKIFEPYFTTKHQSQGTGIGLYMSHEIINKHYHGTLNAKNTRFELEGKNYRGAKFSINIPLIEEDTVL